MKQQFNRAKNNSFITIATLLLFAFFFALFAPMLFSKPEVQAAEPAYGISTEAELKDWLLNTNSLQANHPSVFLQNDIFLKWPSMADDENTGVNSGSTLDGRGFTVTLGGYPTKTYVGTGTTRHRIAFFATWCYGTCKNLRFTLSDNSVIWVDKKTASGNLQVYVGIAFADVSGRIENCEIYLDKNITFNSDGFGANTGLYFGFYTGKLVANGTIINCRSIQTAASKIYITTGTWYNAWLQASMVASNMLYYNGLNPVIKNVYIERWGQIEMKNWSYNGTGAGYEIFGNVVANMTDYESTSDVPGGSISGVIYNGVAGAQQNIIYNRQGKGSGYIVGLEHEGRTTDVSNFYSYPVLTDSAALAKNKCGVSTIPAGYSANFKVEAPNKIQISKDAPLSDEVIWRVKRKRAAATQEMQDTFSQNSTVVLISNMNTEHNNQDLLEIELGRKILADTGIYFGFNEIKQSIVPYYKGSPFTSAILFVDSLGIDTSSDIIYSNNILAGTISSCTLPYINGYYFNQASKLAIPSAFLEKDARTKMTIVAKPLKIELFGSNIYDNKLAISGLVLGELFDLKQANGDIATVGDGEHVFERSSQVTASAAATSPQTNFSNYNIQLLGNITKTTENLSDVLKFNISPYSGIKMTASLELVDDPNLSLINGFIEIRSKNVLELNFRNQVTEGVITNVRITTSAPGKVAFANIGSFSVKPTASRYESIAVFVSDRTTGSDFMFLSEIYEVTKIKKVLIEIKIDQEDNVNVVKSVSLNSAYLTAYYDGGYIESITELTNATVSISLLDPSYKVEFFLNDAPIAAYNNSVSFVAVDAFDKTIGTNKIYLSIKIYKV